MNIPFTGFPKNGDWQIYIGQYSDSCGIFTAYSKPRPVMEVQRYSALNAVTRSKIRNGIISISTRDCAAKYPSHTSAWTIPSPISKRSFPLVLEAHKTAPLPPHPLTPTHSPSSWSPQRGPPGYREQRGTGSWPSSCACSSRPRPAGVAIREQGDEHRNKTIIPLEQKD